MKIFILLILFAFASGIRQNKCTVMQNIKASDLVGFKGYSLGDYMCVAYYSSYYDTSLNRSPTEFGMFQLTSAYWCDDGRTARPRNLCGMKCSALLDADITDDLRCVRLVVEGYTGLAAWGPWKTSCEGYDNTSFEQGC